MVLRIKEREEAIQLITMDLKVCGKLLTTHRRGLGDDVVALHGRFLPWRSAGEGSKIGSHGYRRLWWWKLFFVGSLDVFGVRRYIQEEEVRQWSNMGPTRMEGAPRGQVHPLPRAFLVDCFMQTPSPVDHVCSENHVPEGFIPFGLRLVFLFCETLKQAKKTRTDTGPSANRLVLKII